NPGERIDHRLVVSRNGLTLSIPHQGSVRIQPVEADGEELKNFARVIFIRSGFIVIRHVEIVAHGSIQCDVVQQPPEVSECLAIQNLQVRSEPARISLSDIDTPDHKDLVQRESDALPQLIVSVKGVAEESGLNRI